MFNLLSNGWFFDNNLIKKLKDYRFSWIQISIDSVNRKKHDTFRGLDGCWKKAINAAKLISENGIKLRVASTITPQTLPEMHQICKMAKDLGASHLVFSEVMYSGRAFENRDLFLNDEQRKLFIKQIKDLAREYEEKNLAIFGGTSIKTQSKYAILGGLVGAVIRPDGKV